MIKLNAKVGIGVDKLNFIIYQKGFKESTRHAEYEPFWFYPTPMGLVYGLKTKTKIRLKTLKDIEEIAEKFNEAYQKHLTQPNIKHEDLIKEHEKYIKESRRG